MTTTLGGTTIVDPFIDRDEEFVGRQDRAHDGTLLTEYTAYKYTYNLKWNALTSTERNTILSLYNNITSQNFCPTSGGTVSVVPKRGTYREKEFIIADGTYRYEAELSLTEA